MVRDWPGANDDYFGGDDLNLAAQEMDMFQKKIQQEYDCYLYSTEQASEKMLNEEYDKAAIHTENALRSLRELDRIKKYQESVKQCRELLRMIDEQAKVNAFIRRLKGYE